MSHVLRQLRSRGLTALTFAAAFTVVSVGLASAVTTGLIYACVNNSSGTIHIVSGDTTCANNEIHLVWNAEGPRGGAGATGATGAQGATGATGLQGDSGPQGLTGGTGATGPAGADGAPGADGATGPIGPTGVTGPMGLQGDTGVTGATGPAGARGEDGTDGATGPMGPGGATGATGVTGATGPAGEGGISGYEIVHTTLDFRSADGQTSGSGPAQAYCPVGKVVLGGSVWYTGTPSGQQNAFNFIASIQRPDFDGSRYSWYVSGRWVTHVYAICADAN
jgi:hypothetical protein